MTRQERNQVATGRSGRVETFLLADDGRIPNSRLPLVLLRAGVAVAGEDPAGVLEGTFAANGWTGSWRNGIYGYHHYHSTAHEVLGIARGSAQVRFGGERGETVAVGPGDVVVIPAGVGHKLLQASSDFWVVGAYAGGRGVDLLRDDPDGIGLARLRIAAVPLPEQDPVSGTDGTIVKAWRT